MTFPFGVVASHETWRMEQFSRAYVQAVASAAGCKIMTAPVDDESVDLTLGRKATAAKVRSSRLDVQVKSTYRDCLHANHVAYALDIDTYDDLRATNVLVPRILVVVTMNAAASDWLMHSEANLTLFKCGYWLSLRGAPDVGNTASKTVHLPRSQVFDLASVHQLFTRLENGELP